MPKQTDPSHALDPADAASSFRPTDRIVGRRADDDPILRLEIYGIAIAVFAVALLLAIVTFDPLDVTPTGGTRVMPARNLIGPIGAHVADLFLGAVGLGAFAVAATLALLGVSYVIGRRWRLTRLDVLGWLGAVLCATVLLHVVFAPGRPLAHLPGGLVGAYVGEVLRAFLSTAGTVLFAITGLTLSAIAITRRSVFELGALVGRSAASGWRAARRLLDHGDADEEPVAYEEGAAATGEGARRHRSADAPAAEGQGELALEGPADGRTDGPDNGPNRGAAAEPAADDASAAAAPLDERAAAAGPPAASAAGPKIREPRRSTLDEAAAAPTSPEPSAARPTPAAPERQSAGAAVASPPSGAPLASDANPAPPTTAHPAPQAERVPGPPAAAGSSAGAGAEAESEASAPAPTAPAAEATAEAAGQGAAGIKIIESPAMRRSRDLVVGDQLALAGEGMQVERYEKPPLSVLDYKQPVGQTYDRDQLTRNARLLESKLADYRVKGKVVEIHPGPVITMYEFLPAPGTKISTIANLSDDLAMALSALRIRIVAPIPGKNVVGIEVPNDTREIVWLKEILSDASYQKAKSRLTLALGKDIVGNPTVMNLAKAPHVLVAGATGAGKSVAINSFICSLLYQATPEEVRLIMVDPKMLELSIYEGIPHLLLPVVTDPKQAAIALRWAVREMERRYKLMADLGVRNLAGFNTRVESLLANPAQKLPPRLEMARQLRRAKGEEDPSAPDAVVLDADGIPIEKMPLIVVIIDELADLMMVAAKEVETSIARLAQMARASGIHLILATQRPSVDVITGLIKANFPTRISFQVASKIDSRTILDTKGAEALLGMGDMLYLGPGTSSLKRVHGCFVSEDEVHRIVSHLKEQGSPDYDLAILTPTEDDSGKGATKGGDEYDEMYDRAVQIIAETRNASISFLQRKLKIGYNRSARIIEKMEEEGIVGPSDGTSRPREVFVDPI